MAQILQGTWETNPAPGEEQTMELVLSANRDFTTNGRSCGNNGREVRVVVYVPALSDLTLFSVDMCLEPFEKNRISGSFKTPEQVGEYDISVRLDDGAGDPIEVYDNIGFIEIEEPPVTQPVSASVSCRGVADAGDSIEVAVAVDPAGAGVASVPVTVGGQQVWEAKVQTDGSQTTTTVVIPKGLIPEGVNQPVEIPTQV